MDRSDAIRIELAQAGAHTGIVEIPNLAEANIVQRGPNTGFTGVPIDLPTEGPLVQSDRIGTATPIPSLPGNLCGISPIAVRGKRKSKQINCQVCLWKTAPPVQTIEASTQTDLSNPSLIKASDIPTLPGISPEQNYEFRVSVYKSIMALYGPDKIFVQGENVFIYH